MGRPRLFSLGYFEGLAHRFGNDLRTDELRVPFHRRSIERDQVEILMRLFMETLGARLRSDRHQRRPIHVRVGDPRKKVRRTWAKRRQANARFPGEPALDVGHESRALLMARLEKMDLGIKDRLQHGDVFFARYAKHVFESLVFETTD